MRKRLLSLLLLSICGSMLFAQERWILMMWNKFHWEISHTNGGIYMTVLHYMESAGLY